VHEAGHVLLAHLFPFDWHAFTDILPAGQVRIPLPLLPPSLVPPLPSPRGQQGKEKEKKKKGTFFFIFLFCLTDRKRL